MIYYHESMNGIFRGVYSGITTDMIERAAIFGDFFQSV